MKKLISLFLLVCVVGAAFASCDLVRKYEPPTTQKAPAADEDQSSADTGGVNTGFSDTEEAAGSENDVVRLTKDEALALLNESFTDEEKEAITVDADADMIGQSNGTEYYIFNAVKETENEDGETESENITYYVSTNAAVYMSLEEENATVSRAAKLFTDKHGLADDDGNGYKIEYLGLVMNMSAYCYNFEVYVEKGGNDVYVTDFLVSLDGHSYGENRKN